MRKIIKVAICDDEELVRQDLIRVLQRVLEKEQFFYEIYAFSSGAELLGSKEDIQLLFLDMDMPGLDGIDVGMRVLEKHPWCRIVIASGREDRFKETYKVRPLGFVSKPFDEEEIRDVIMEYDGATIGTETIEVFKDREAFHVQQRDIRYVAAFSGYVEMLVDGELYRKNVCN